MKTHHTPGPWRAEGCAIYAGETRVAQTWDTWHEGLPTPTMEADAGLIAAAPDVLKALRDILQWWTEMDGEFDDMPVELWDQAQDAMAKAKGGTK